MKKGMFLALALLVAWHYFSKESDVPHKASLQDAGIVTRPTAQSASGFKCDGRVYCSQMTSRAEAEFFVRNCPDTKMDGDRDGIPCENDSRF